MPPLLRVIIEMALPVAALSWLLFYRLYHRGELSRDADRDTISSSLKQIKESSKDADRPPDPLLHRKWMKFGGGLYGVAALWTLLVVEASDMANAIAHPADIKHLFDGGVINFIVNGFLGQIGNFVQAVTWFNWWPDKDHGMILWLLAAMAGYHAGSELARHETALGSQLTDWDWRTQLRAWLDKRRSR